jgi:23S rRNA pseudouridine2605 synthase
MVSHRKDASPAAGRGQASAGEGGERVARALARAGVASRREAERLIAAGRVALNGEPLTSPAVNVGLNDILTLDGKPVAEREPARLWRYHKPPGLITTHKDPKGRPTVFERLPPGLPRVISVGRLDLSSEGLLLLTNDGELARQLELPSSGVVRRYRARAYGHASQEKLDRLAEGITVEGMAYGPIRAHLDGGKGANVWITLELGEGKNREVRRVLEALGLKVNRLIRVSYGPIELGDLPAGAADEVPSRLVKRLLAGEITAPSPASPRQSKSVIPDGPKGRSGTQTGARSRSQHLGPGSAARPRGPAAGMTAKAQSKPEGRKQYKTGWARPKRRGKPAPRKP